MTLWALALVCIVTLSFMSQYPSLPSLYPSLPFEYHRRAVSRVFVGLYSWTVLLRYVLKLFSSLYLCFSTLGGLRPVSLFVCIQGHLDLCCYFRSSVCLCTENRFDISPQETICMKRQILFSGKNN